MDLRQIKNLMKEFEDSTIHKLEINDKEFSIKLEKEDKKIFSSTPIIDVAPSQSIPVTDHVKEVAAEVNEYTEVKAPLVGTFYPSPSPESESFVSVGSKVKKGDTLFIIEAMKVMNEITAPVNGTVMSIQVTEGTMVEFGQVVLEIAE